MVTVLWGQFILDNPFPLASDQSCGVEIPVASLELMRVPSVAFCCDV